MAKYTCPSCGAPFDGKKCRNCAYESFSEEVAHNLHVHEGEPLVIQDTARKRVPYKDPFDCPQPHREKKRSGKRHGLFTILLIIFLAVFLLNILPILFARVVRHPEPDVPAATLEAVTLPLNGKTLLDNEDFSIIAQWQDGRDDSTAIPIYIVNHTDRTYDFSAKHVIVNGSCLDDFCSFYATVSSGDTVEARLFLSDQGLQLANIAQIQQIEFTLDAHSYDSNDPSGEPLEAGPFVLRGNAAADYVQTDRTDSKMLYADDGLILSYLGLWADDYAENLEDMELIFCAENSGTEALSLYDAQILVNGEVSGVGLWADLPAQSKTFFRVFLYGIDLSKPEDIQSFRMTLYAYDGERDTLLEDIAVPINE